MEPRGKSDQLRPFRGAHHKVEQSLAVADEKPARIVVSAANTVEELRDGIGRACVRREQQRKFATGASRRIPAAVRGSVGETADHAVLIDGEPCPSEQPIAPT